MAAAVVHVSATASNVVYPNNPLIWYHGRWDSSYGTWWTGSGLTLHVEGLSSLSLQLGPNTTSPSVAVGLSVNYGEFTTLQLAKGANEIPLGLNSTTSSRTHSSVIRLNVQGWQNNNLYLEKITLNSGAKLRPYTPSQLNFQFIGDSLSSGQYIPNGVDGAWPFLAAETFKAEQLINAQPGGCLTDQFCWGNAHGISYQFFKTEDNGYYYNPNHNYTTDWDFRRDYRATHVFVEVGANDNAYNITAASITSTYLDFLVKLRRIYPVQPIFVVGIWGWPSSDGSVYYYYDGVFENVVAQRNAKGDKRVYFIDTKGWVGWDDIYSDNSHPNQPGSVNIAAKLGAWLKNWGLQPQKKWPTKVD
ncbi:carbohydrate esterase family 2 protein [Serendipita vermifera MAFF 305830]|uniref:Carbohydrate esterase family 2 protein n=1 Tax=Serendipita vermifera MAFF 305830 TaxID=933852 RepID=A0A0C3BKX0_SERVB|nr:carbohydrate esterase family 2 protein [Serendipita vermifera MAFF 305830]